MLENKKNENFCNWLVFILICVSFIVMISENKVRDNLIYDYINHNHEKIHLLNKINELQKEINNLNKHLEYHHGKNIFYL